LNEFASETWRPDDENADGNHDNPLEGTAVDLDWADDSYNESGRYPILTVETKDGTRVKVHAFRTVLRSLLIDKMRPNHGEEVVIRFDGITKSKGGTEYYSYSGFVKGRQGGALNWGPPQNGPTAAPEYEPAPEPVAAAAAPSAQQDDIPF
jgi:hypothetical protein